MPLYEYHCTDCDTNVEILVRSISEQPRCPECESTSLVKQLSVAAAPTVSGGSASALPVANQGGTCGRSQCQSGCMFD